MRFIRISETVATGEHGDVLRVQYDNRGEPYREGCQIQILSGDDRIGTHIFLEDDEVRRLRDALSKMLGDTNLPSKPTPCDS